MRPRKLLFALIALCKIASATAEPVIHDTAIGDETRAEPTRIIIFGGTRGAGRHFTTVVSTLGCRKCDAPPDYIGNRNVIDAASAAGVRHVVLVSTIGAGDSADAMPFFVKVFLRDRIDRKTQAENHLRASDLDFTIVRPGGLKDGEPTGHSILTTDPSVMGFIRRADLARLLVGVLDDPNTFGKTYSALDPK